MKPRSPRCDLAAIHVLRDLPLVFTPKVGADSRITMEVSPLVPKSDPWSVDGFGTAALGHADRSRTTTHDGMVKDTRTVDRPVMVLVGEAERRSGPAGSFGTGAGEVSRVRFGA